MNAVNCVHRRFLNFHFTFLSTLGKTPRTSASEVLGMSLKIKIDDVSLLKITVIEKSAGRPYSEQINFC